MSIMMVTINTTSRIESAFHLGGNFPNFSRLIDCSSCDLLAGSEIERLSEMTTRESLKKCFGRKIPESYYSTTPYFCSNNEIIFTSLKTFKT